jgi:hypothetical protein
LPYVDIETFPSIAATLFIDTINTTWNRRELRTSWKGFPHPPEQVLRLEMNVTTTISTTIKGTVFQKCVLIFGPKTCHQELKLDQSEKTASGILMSA